MKKFLAVTRRIFLAGTISLLIILILYLIKYPGLFFAYSNYLGKAYLIFATASPFLWLIFWLISTAYIRKKGQSAAYQQTISFGKTMAQMLVHDLLSPFALIKEQFVSSRKLKEYYGSVAGPEIAKMLVAGSRAINRERLLRMILRFVIYILGILVATNTLPQILK